MKPRIRTLSIVAAAGGLVAVAIIGTREAPRAAAGTAPPAHAAPAAPAAPAPTPAPAPVTTITPVAAPATPPAPAPIGDRKIQIALLLDTSSSMDGLIDQAKSQLWKVVNEFAHAQKDGKRARLEIALYEYGNDGLSARNGWIRRIQPLTTDLDRVSEALFALRTNGGEEYAGQVIRTAVQQLEWSASPDDLKLVFIAGNEPFDQGPVTPAKAIALATGKGIRVNVIHCGGDDPTWSAGAALAKGSYMTIDQDRTVAHIAAPQDDEIARLGVELNNTYLAYGLHGKEGLERQSAQDGNAKAAAQGALVQRSMSKASRSSYRNSTWDLVDAYEDKEVDLDKLAEADLPEEMKKMTPAERKAHVEARLAERGRIHKRIAELGLERDKFVDAERAKQGDAAASTLDTALIGVVHKEGSNAGWRFE